MNLEQKTDEAVILSAQKGNRKNAFEFFYKKYSEQILNYSFYLSRNKEKAISNTQDTFVKLYLKFNKYDLNKKNNSTFKTWLFSIAKNNYLDSFEKQKKHNVIDNNKDISEYKFLLSNSPNPEQELISKNLYNEIQKTINSIEPKYKKVLKLLEKSYSYKEMAEKLEIPMGTLKVHVLRARKILKEKLKVNNNYSFYQ